MAGVQTSPILKHRAIIEFPSLLAGARVRFELQGDRSKLMVNCPKCGAGVREEKAFCHNCGAPMDAAMRQREEPQPDFGATMLEPPRVALPSSPVAPEPDGRRKSSRKIGFGFVILLLFLMFVVFVLAVVLD
jgi:hypothetical protein